MNGSLSEWIRRNAAYKILSLAIAVLLYLVASAQSNPRSTSTATVRATFLRLPNRLAEPAEATATLSVRLVGPLPLHEAARAGLRALVDATDAKPGPNRLPVRYVLPPGVEGAVEVEGPPTTDIVLENKEERSLPVDAWFDQSEPPPGFEYGNVVLEPNRCTVSGSKRQIERVSKVVARIEKSPEDAATVDREVAVLAVDDSGREVPGVDLRPARVRFRLPLQRASLVRNLVLNPRLVGRTATGFRLKAYRFDPPTVAVRGNAVALLQRMTLDVPVDIGGLRRSVTREIAIPLPRGFQRTEKLPVRLEITIEPESLPVEPTGPEDSSGNPPAQPAPEIPPPTP